MNRKLLFKTDSFTIIELFMVVLLTSIIFTLSMSFYTRFLVQNDLENTTNQLIGELRKAQIYSMMSRQNNSWGVNYSSQKITLFKGAALGEDHAFDEVFDVNPRITVNGITEIYFNRATGIPSSTLTITITGNNDTRIVTVNPQGVASR